MTTDFTDLDVLDETGQIPKLRRGHQKTRQHIAIEGRDASDGAPADSWWAGVDRATFNKRRAERFDAMRRSRFGRLMINYTEPA